MNLTGLSRVLTGLAFLSAAILVAQARYVQMAPAIIQQGLDLYKGNDTTREAALVRLFSEAGCSVGAKYLSHTAGADGREDVIWTEFVACR